MGNKFRFLFSRNNPLQHYFHHFLVANAGLFVAFVIFGSATVWEVVLYFFFAFIPVADEFFYVIIHYLDYPVCRKITHLFVGSEYLRVLNLLHRKRGLFKELAVHNLFVYVSLLAFLYVFLIFDRSLGFYAVFGILMHLGQDIANDQKELGSLTRWLWPAQLVARWSL